MDEFMQVNRNPGNDALQSYERAFVRALEGSEAICGLHAFQRPEGNSWRDQALAGMYDAQMVALDQLEDGEIERLQNRTDDAQRATRGLFDDPEFETAVRTATNTPSRVQYRIGRLVDALRGLDAE
jgi:hypothetical protein